LQNKRGDIKLIAYVAQGVIYFLWQGSAEGAAGGHKQNFLKNMIYFMNGPILKS